MAADGREVGDEVAAVVLVLNADRRDLTALHLAFDLIAHDLSLEVLASSEVQSN